MGNVLERDARRDGVGYKGTRHARPAAGISPRRHPQQDRGGSRRLGHLPPTSPVMSIQVAAPTALLVASRAEQADVAVLLRGLGFHAVQVEGADALNDLREPLSLCLIDLRETGEELRVA